ncbi:MAG: hypothetical protein HY703_02840, partial [Gemmatimonadetes bacterium]|nr:hypothetical protein [Gemmatimonadota bacterium]
VSFSATALTLNLKIQALYLTQSTQTQSGSVPLVKDRNAYLRVFVTANESNSATPVVRVRFYQGSNLLDTRTIAAPGSSVPTSLNEEPLTASWNTAIPGSLIQPNVSILADADPDRTLLEADKTDNTFPASGTAQALDVRTANAFQLRLVPVRLAASNNLTGDVTESNKADYTSLTGKVYPLPSVDADIRAAYSTNAVLTVDDANDGWGILLRELDALRVADNSPRYYYGVVKVPFSGSTGAGIAISPGTAAWGWDTPDGSAGLTGRGQIAAHEWAHNWNRLHSPCGSPAGPDPEYPYANGVIGVYGLDVAASALKSPSLPDIVSYCANPWISDYTYRGVLNYRATNFEPPPAAAAGPELSLLVWGGISRGRLVLEPAFPVLTRPVLPREPGPYTLEGLDAGGARLFSFAFRPADLVDGPQPAASFAFAIPARLLEPDRLAVLRVSGPEGEATRASPAAFAAAAAGPAPAPPRASLRRRAGDVVELSWDGGAYPMVMVRDPRTGLVLSFAREGAVTIGTAARELELVFSDGVQGTARRATIR